MLSHEYINQKGRKSKRFDTDDFPGGGGVVFSQVLLQRFFASGVGPAVLVCEGTAVGAREISGWRKVFIRHAIREGSRVERAYQTRQEERHEREKKRGHQTSPLPHPTPYE